VVVWRTTRSGEPLAPGEVSADGRRILVGFADGALEVAELQAPGKRRMDAATFLRGWRGELGPAARVEP
jgi:methionyl-tRNA formyltransferase